jgi:hypothetical protein
VARVTAGERLGDGLTDGRGERVDDGRQRGGVRELDHEVAQAD